MVAPSWAAGRGRQCGGVEGAGSERASARVTLTLAAKDGILLGCGEGERRRGRVDWLE